MDDQRAVRTDNDPDRDWQNSRELFPVTAERGADGKLRLAGLALDGLAGQYRTPLYLYDGLTLRQQADGLRSLLDRYYPGDSEITYAAKAYFGLRMAHKLAGLGLGVDVVSRGEMSIARRAGFPAEKVHLHGNNKSEEELEQALRWGVQAVVVDSLEELAFLDELAARLQTRARIWLRLTPGLHVDTHPYRQTAHPTSKFGLLVQDGQALEGIRRALASPRLELTGLHAHLGSQLFETDTYVEAVNLLVEVADRAGYIPREFSPGGGWGVRYTRADPQPDPERWVKTVTEGVSAAFNRRNWPLPRLIIEPGRYLVGRAGVALYRVGTTKVVSGGLNIAAVDGGMADNPRPALYRSRYTAVLANRNPAGQERPTSIVGKFCESGDVLIQQIDLPELRRGDLLAMPAAGAYQLSMSSNYNLAPRPAVLWLENGQAEVLQTREEPDAQDSWWVGPGEEAF